MSRTAPPRMPPVPPSQLPQTVAPSRASRALQLASFTLATGVAFYSVLLYDFGPQEHCFMPIRRWFDSNTAGLFTLSENDRRTLLGQQSQDIKTPHHGIVPETKTPIEFFKSERRSVTETREREGRQV
ncbi:hypothetical protein T439DRAFT_378183 [Meredithblackwellia eburnea MCA 4105]